MTTESIDVCLTFDTTGSMYPCLTQVRRAQAELVKRLFKDIPNLRIAVIAHGDYCDAGDPYVTKTLDFSSDKKKICKFIEKVESTYGGDAPECYELVLHESRLIPEAGQVFTFHGFRFEILRRTGNRIMSLRVTPPPDDGDGDGDGDGD